MGGARHADGEIVTFADPIPRAHMECCGDPVYEVRFLRETKWDVEHGKHYTRKDARCVNCDATRDPERVLQQGAYSEEEEGDWL